MNDQDDILANTTLTQSRVEVPWSPGQRNFRSKVVILDGTKWIMFKALHRYDGVVACRIEGAPNTQRSRDRVAAVLAGLAEAVRLGQVEFDA